MTVDPMAAEHTAEHAGRTYAFCGEGCRTRFIAEPRAFLEHADHHSGTPATGEL
jgi:Cu+-exporting ATPase